LFLGTKHKELQVPTMADPAELFKSASSAPDWYTTTKQSYGTLVIDALLDASHIPVAQGVQGVVC